MTKMMIVVALVVVSLLGTGALGMAEKKKSDFEDFPPSDAPGIKIAISRANEHAVIKNFQENGETIPDGSLDEANENKVLEEPVEEDAPSQEEQAPTEDQASLEEEVLEVVDEEVAPLTLPAEPVVEESTEQTVNVVTPVQQETLAPPRVSYFSTVSLSGGLPAAVTPVDEADNSQTTTETENSGEGETPAAGVNVLQTPMVEDKNSGSTAASGSPAASSGGEKVEVSSVPTIMTGFGAAFFVAACVSGVLRTILTSSGWAGGCVFQDGGRVKGLRRVPFPERPKRPFRLLSQAESLWSGGR
ncbi:MAG: hypothetical protein ACK4GQ_03500 [Candidatus Hadarchaeales archaeon]